MLTRIGFVKTVINVLVNANRKLHFEEALPKFDSSTNASSGISKTCMDLSRCSFKEQRMFLVDFQKGIVQREKPSREFHVSGWNAFAYRIIVGGVGVGCGLIIRENLKIQNNPEIGEESNYIWIGSHCFILLFLKHAGSK